jgi:hypothetical protein
MRSGIAVISLITLRILTASYRPRIHLYDLGTSDLLSSRSWRLAAPGNHENGCRHGCRAEGRRGDPRPLGDAPHRPYNLPSSHFQSKLWAPQAKLPSGAAMAGARLDFAPCPRGKSSRSPGPTRGGELPFDVWLRAPAAREFSRAQEQWAEQPSPPSVWIVFRAEVRSPTVPTLLSSYLRSAHRSCARAARKISSPFGNRSCPSHDNGRHCLCRARARPGLRRRSWRRLGPTMGCIGPGFGQPRGGEESRHA